MGDQFDLQAFLKTVGGAPAGPAAPPAAVESRPPPPGMASYKEGQRAEAAAAQLMGLLQPGKEAEAVAATPEAGVAAPEAPVAPATASHTAAAAALAHAAAAGLSGNSGEDAARKPVGRPLVATGASVYDVEAVRGPELLPQLEVSPITMYNTEYALSLGHQIAVNKNYLCYGLKGGQIRILNMDTATRALLRGHTSPVGDLRFFSNSVDILGTSARDGRLFIRKVVESEGAISEVVVLTVHLTEVMDENNPAALVGFCWHATDPNVFAVSARGAVLLCRVDDLAAAADGAALAISLEAPPEGATALPGHTAQVTDLAFSPDGDYLASGSEDGTVRVASTASGETLVQVTAHGGAPVHSVAWAEDPSQPLGAALISGGALNAEVKVWVLDPDLWLADCKQTVLLAAGGLALEEAFFNHALWDPASSLLLLANTKRNALYALRLEPGAGEAAPHFSNLAEFPVTMPVLSFTSLCETAPRASQDSSSGEASAVQVFCVQTAAIQQYSLDPARCHPNPAEMPAALQGAMPAPMQPAVPEPEPEPEPAPAAEAPLPVVAAESAALVAAAAAEAAEVAEAPPASPPALLTPTQLLALMQPKAAPAEGAEASPEPPPSAATSASPTPPTPLTPAPTLAAAPATAPGLTADALNVAMITAMAPLVEELRYRDTALLQRLESLVLQQADLAAAERRTRDQAEKERQKALLEAMSASIHRDLPLQLEQVVKKELQNLAPTISQALAAPLQQLQANTERQVSATVEAALASHLGPTVAPQLAEQFRSAFAGTLLPVFEAGTAAMFKQVQAAMEVGVQQHVAALQQQTVPLADSLHRSVAAAAGLAENMAVQQAALAAAVTSVQAARTRGGADAAASGPLDSMVKAVSVAELEQQMDPTIELERLLAAGRIEDAFNRALTLSDVSIVNWLVARVDPSQAPQLSQALLLSLSQQLGCDLETDTMIKLSWLQQAVLSLDTADALLAPHMRPVLQGVYASLQPLLANSEHTRTARMVLHLLNSLLQSCQ